MKANQFKILLGWVLGITIINLIVLIITLTNVFQTKAQLNNVNNYVHHHQLSCSGTLNVSLSPQLDFGSISSVNPLQGNVPVSLSCN